MYELSPETITAIKSLQGLWQANAYATAPDLSSLTQQGYPSSGNPGRGNAPTIPGDAWFYLTDMARLTLIHLAGEVPSNPPSVEQYARCLTKVGNFIADGTINFAKLSASSIANLNDCLKGNSDKLVTAQMLKEYIYQSVCPRGTCQCFLAKAAPKNWLVMDQSRLELEDDPEMVRLLWEFGLTRGDGSTYAVLPNMNGRVFQGTTTISEVCKYLESELPNISGSYTARIFSKPSGEEIIGVNNGVGAFSISKENYGDNLQLDGWYNRQSMNKISFRASSSSAIHNGSKLQPSALQLLACIRC